MPAGTPSHIELARANSRNIRHISLCQSPSSSVRVKSLARNFEESSLEFSALENIGAREFREGLGEKKGTSRRLLAEGFTPGRFSPNKDMAGSVTQSLACWMDARTLELQVFPAPGSVLFAPLEKSSAQRCAVLLRHASGKPTLICSFGEISLGGKTFLTPWNAWKTCTPGNRWHRSPVSL